ncbi:MAG: hypothetical protein AAGD01_17405 [Acidobacteriota bacterium]
MKKLFRTTFCLALAAAFVFGLGIVLAPEAEAGASCPICWVPFDSAHNWSLAGSCEDWSDPHCPVLRGLYRGPNNQLCKGNGIVANM